MAGREVVDVNVTVSDVKLPDAGAWAFLLVLGLGAVGLAVGQLMESDLEPGDLVRRRDRRERIRGDRRRVRGDWRQ
ncbi:hypothetical protein [Streptomyces werraensis]|uniref:hypothetical protein n=1 Tax=Streptomyces werraensis TaxID=68284 RepID=UPI003F4E074C